MGFGDREPGRAEAGSGASANAKGSAAAALPLRRSAGGAPAAAAVAANKARSFPSRTGQCAPSRRRPDPGRGAGALHSREGSRQRRRAAASAARAGFASPTCVVVVTRDIASFCSISSRLISSMAGTRRATRRCWASEAGARPRGAGGWQLAAARWPLQLCRGAGAPLALLGAPVVRERRRTGPSSAAHAARLRGARAPPPAALPLPRRRASRSHRAPRGRNRRQSCAQTAQPDRRGSTARAPNGRPRRRVGRGRRR